MADSPETIVLLHGIGRTAASMWFLEMRLRRRGYRTLNVTYPSRRMGLAALAAHLRQAHLTDAFWREAGKVHFVTHSMGGLLARRYLEDFAHLLPPEKIGRAVMLGPPHGGSEIADLIHRLWLYRKIFGPAGQELTTMAAAAWTTMPPCETGIIAGTAGWLYPDALFILRGPHDGRVTVARTRLPGMQDHVTVPSSHGMIMFRPATFRHIIQFIQTGRFGGVP